MKKQQQQHQDSYEDCINESVLAICTVYLIEKSKRFVCICENPSNNP